MKRKRYICRCGWHSESFQHRSERVDNQAKLHRARCQKARDHRIEEEDCE